MAYSDKVLDHYENPRNVGSFGKDDDTVGTGMVGAPACGDVMKLQIRVGADGIIEDAIKAAVADYRKKHGLDAAPDAGKVGAEAARAQAGAPVAAD